jgi:hypothetical protein
MMEVICKIHISKDEIESKKITHVLMTMREYQVREMVVYELKKFNYGLQTVNFIEVDNNLLLEKIRNMIDNLESYRDSYIKNKY